MLYPILVCLLLAPAGIATEEEDSPATIAKKLNEHLKNLFNNGKYRELADDIYADNVTLQFKDTGLEYNGRENTYDLIKQSLVDTIEEINIKKVNYNRTGHSIDVVGVARYTVRDRAFTKGFRQVLRKTKNDLYQISYAEQFDVNI